MIDVKVNWLDLLITLTVQACARVHRDAMHCNALTRYAYTVLLHCGARVAARQCFLMHTNALSDERNKEAGVKRGVWEGCNGSETRVNVRVRVCACGRLREDAKCGCKHYFNLETVLSCINAKDLASLQKVLKCLGNCFSSGAFAKLNY